MINPTPRQITPFVLIGLFLAVAIGLQLVPTASYQSCSSSLAGGLCSPSKDLDYGHPFRYKIKSLTGHVLSARADGPIEYMETGQALNDPEAFRNDALLSLCIFLVPSAIVGLIWRSRYAHHRH